MYQYTVYRCRDRCYEVCTCYERASLECIDLLLIKPEVTSRFTTPHALYQANTMPDPKTQGSSTASSSPSLHDGLTQFLEAKSKGDESGDYRRNAN